MDRPELLVVNRLDALASGSPFVFSFVEVWNERIVVRLLGLAAGVGREIVDLGLRLRDDRGREYQWLGTSSGGMVLPEEVSIGFGAPPGDSALFLELVTRDEGVIHRFELP